MTKKFSITKWEGMNEVGEGEDVPMSKKLKAIEYIVLSTIAMTQSHNGYSDTTQKQMSEMTPYSVRSIGKALDNLLEFEYEGKKVLERTTKTSIKGKVQYVHKLLPNPLFSVYGESHDMKKVPTMESNDMKLLPIIENHDMKILPTLKKESSELKKQELKNKEEETTMREFQPKEVINEYIEAMKEFEQFEPRITWGRDMKLSKKFLSTVEDLSNNDKKKLIRIIVENYPKWSSNTAKFPLQVSTLSIEWIQNKAREELKNEKEKESQIESQSVEATERNKDSMKSIMDRIKKGGN